MLKESKKGQKCEVSKKLKMDLVQENKDTYAKTVHLCI